jgi:hypothetical protein
MGEVQYIYADIGSSRAQVAFSSIVHAMFKRGLMALVRWVSRDDGEPKMGICKAEPGDVDYMMWVQVSTTQGLWLDLTIYAAPRSHSLRTSGVTVFPRWIGMFRKKAKCYKCIPTSQRATWKLLWTAGWTAWTSQTPVQKTKMGWYQT